MVAVFSVLVAVFSVLVVLVTMVLQRGSPEYLQYVLVVGVMAVLVAVWVWRTVRKNTRRKTMETKPVEETNRQRSKRSCLWKKALPLTVLLVVGFGAGWVMSFDTWINEPFDSLVWGLLVPIKEPFGANMILPGLWLGDREDGRNRKELEKREVYSVLIATRDFWPKTMWVDFDWAKASLADSHSTNIEPFFALTNAWIDEHREKGDKVLVHCAAGRSRSASIVIAYLMNRLDLTLAQALQFVKSKRPQVSPNSSFMKELKAYEDDLRLKRLSKSDPASLDFQTWNRTYTANADRVRDPTFALFDRDVLDAFLKKTQNN